ncbi:P-loop containing nucleoside triphosphate hydrolases superfamily protein [Arabidopsis thaliana]|jgi:SpoVK/Ycf46/Vps4 family AAA+-type ATPase|uniref:P-loop containing nucleoside triphosphate hydrolases superfamily protein n=2 Tax=Arabidopsis thaliana TaxID=3702 RepID=F4KHN5_ARATH|nr:P-loop containing nucleoside triphosphate hydrolases superfamily protein [Arabidopsis thaliana]AED96272.1 P-loop containing nucleoside triphosphate hydrolases superfamily protein [Arabidopsis thaliana]|eukprot:NP_001078747.1 P-loop containing nucleoside triphosphate hydrolases superfamily protein [Arabidopsis thaliana]
MEQKSVLLSALGVGVGLGIGLASGQSLGRWANGSGSVEDGLTGEQIEQELIRQIVDGRESTVTFEEFPYFLSKRTRELLTSVAYVHLKEYDISKHTRNLAPASKAILLSGPAEFYQQMLAKALSHYFESKLLLLDITDFSIKIQSKYGCTKREPFHKRSISELTLDKVSSLMGSFSMLSQREVEPRGTLRRHTSGNDLKSRSTESSNRLPRHKRNASAASDISSISSRSSSSVSASRKRTTNLCFDEKLFLQSLYKVLSSVSETTPLIIYLRDVEKLLESERFYKLFQRLLNKLSGPVLILGSRVLEPEDDCQEVDESISALFPYNIEIRPPEDESQLVSWKSRLEDDMKMIQFQDNKNHIAEVLAANDIQCDDLSSICHADTMCLSNHIEEIVVSAITYHLIHTKEPEYRNGKLVISSKSLSHGLSIFQEGGNRSFEDSLKLDTNTDSKRKGGEVCSKSESKSGPENKNESEISLPSNKNDNPLPPKAPEVVPDNEFEKRIRPEVIPANEIGVTFADIGSLDETKDSLQELVMLPLRRPDLFQGGLLKPCRGILLFGPPGTGKTMLAKAIANEAGASFINVSMSTITSKWFGEDEKNVRALFTLAAKVSPTIIFVDEVDSMLGQRTRVGEHEAMRKIKNEFMTHWDGLMTKPGERILVLAATNRPFDLDEAIIRRFERRIMVGLPSIESREKILRTLLSKEKTENLDFHELGQITEGYSGSDLKNLCITAAYRPVRELIQQERLKDQERKKREEAGKGTEESKEEEAEASEERVITLRPLNMEDMRKAKTQVAASFASEGAGMNELKQWNDLYGEGGSRKKEQLTYFL